MEMSQGNSLCRYLKQPKISFFKKFYKIEEQEGVTGPGGLLPVRMERMWGKGVGR
jgi:hypothetical protein